MQRYDLRHLHDDFYSRMGELINNNLKVGEVGIFLFEVGDYSSIQKSADFIKELGHELMNSLKFNEVDWTIVVKKVDAKTIAKRKEEEKKDKEKAEAKAKAEVKSDQEAEIKTKEDSKKTSTKKTTIRKKATTAKKKGK